MEDMKTFVTFGSIEQPEFAAKLPDFITQVSVLECQKPNGQAADSDQWGLCIKVLLLLDFIGSINKMCVRSMLRASRCVKNA